MELKDIAWENARVINGLDPKKWRIDACGARIHYDRYDAPGMMYAWQIDHIFPQSALEKADVPQELIDDSANIRALATRNNQSKSDNYPVYRRSYIWHDGKNVEIDENTDFANCRTNVGPFTQEKIKELYKDYLKTFKSGDLNK